MMRSALPLIVGAGFLLPSFHAGAARADAGTRKLAAAYKKARRGDAAGLASLEKLARKGGARAQMALALVLDPPPGQGPRTPPDARSLKRADGLYMASAEQGYAPAQTCFALHRCSDPRESLRWLYAAAKQGHAGAFLALSEKLAKSDPPAAFEYLRKAARAGDPVAQTAFAVRLNQRAGGIGHAPPEAVEMLHRAADAGWTQAQGLLGSYYYADGKGDRIESYKWLSLAAAQDPEARPSQEAVGETLRESERAEAARRAAPLAGRVYKAHHVCYDESLEKEPAPPL